MQKTVLKLLIGSLYVLAEEYVRGHICSITVSTTYR